MAVSVYNARFFRDNVEGSLRSARIVVPLVLEMTKAKSVIDFGCGMGTWLRAFRENGVDDVLGLDGAYVDQNKLQIDPTCFVECDLSRSVKRDRRYDLAISLEVGEHLPTPASRDLVNSLAAAAPIVMFSAALPGQGGTSHCNEQWPEFWEELFGDAGMTKLDVIRPKIFHDSSIEWWYRQNIYLFADDPALIATEPTPFPTDLELISTSVLQEFKSFRGLRGKLKSAMMRALKNRSARRGWASQS